MRMPLVLACLLALAPSPASQERSQPAGDWPHLRGPTQDGASPEGGAFGAQSLGLRVAWRRELGPSYSGVALGAGLALTLFSDGESDRVIALDAADGSERWQRVLEPTYLGHDGSEDGPISSPTIGAGSAWVISARGRLVALRLADGSERWSKDLPAELGTVLPEYGFGSTPLLEGGRLVVQAGGSAGRAVCAFEPETGALSWACGEGAASYASPVAMDLAGRRQLVVLNGRELLGVAPESGALLWTHVLPGERDQASSGMASALDGERFLASVGGSIAVFRVTRTQAGFAVSEELRTSELGRSYALPVYAAGHLWGFKSDFLTCVDAASGARRWKSRPPGGRGLIRVGERLVVLGAQGVVAVVAATPDDYHELARVEALDHTDYAWPSYADGRVYVRNSSALACVEAVPGAPASPAGAPPSASARAELELERELAAAADPAARVEAFLAEHPAFPVLDGERVHFFWRGEAQDVAISGNFLDGSRPDPLRRLGSSDLFHRAYPIEPGARFEYRFQVDYGPWRPDPRNPATAPSAGGEPMSVVATPGRAARETWSPLPEGPRGRRETLSFTSAALGNTRELELWLPPGYDASAQPCALLIVHEGPDWLASGGLAHTLDHLVGASVRPVIAVFVPPVEQWWYEGGGTGTEEYVDMLARELVPFLAARYRLSARPEERVLLGKESFGLTVLLGALRHPETFGRAGVLSFAQGDRARHTLYALLEEAPRPGLAFFVGWNRYGLRNRDGGFDYRAESARVAEALRARGYPVAGGEALDGCGWSSWRERVGELLEALLPPG